MKTGEHTRWNLIWALLPSVQQSLVLVLLFMSCHISLLFWGSVGCVLPTHSITCTRNPELESIGGVFVGEGVWVCVNTPLLPSFINTAVIHCSCSLTKAWTYWENPERLLPDLFNQIWLAGNGIWVFFMKRYFNAFAAWSKVQYLCTGLSSYSVFSSNKDEIDLTLKGLSTPTFHSAFWNGLKAQSLEAEE